MVALVNIDENFLQKKTIFLPNGKLEFPIAVSNWSMFSNPCVGSMGALFMRKTSNTASALFFADLSMIFDFDWEVKGNLTPKVLWEVLPFGSKIEAMPVKAIHLTFKFLPERIWYKVLNINNFPVPPGPSRK